MPLQSQRRGHRIAAIGQHHRLHHPATSLRLPGGSLLAQVDPGRGPLPVEHADIDSHFHGLVQRFPRSAILNGHRRR